MKKQMSNIQASPLELLSSIGCMENPPRHIRLETIYVWKSTDY